MLSYSVIFDYVVHILVAATRKVYKNRAVIHLLRQLDAVGNRVGAFYRRDDTFHTGKLEEGIDSLFVVDDVILNATDLLKECVLRA